MAGASVYIIGNSPTNHISSFWRASSHHGRVQVIRGEQRLAEEILVFLPANRPSWQQQKKLAWSNTGEEKVQACLTSPAAGQQSKATLCWDKMEALCDLPSTGWQMVLMGVIIPGSRFCSRHSISSSRAAEVPAARGGTAEEGATTGGWQAGNLAAGRYKHLWLFSVENQRHNSHYVGFPNVRQ